MIFDSNMHSQTEEWLNALPEAMRGEVLSKAQQIRDRYDPFSGGNEPTLMEAVYLVRQKSGSQIDSQADEVRKTIPRRNP